MRHRSSSAPLPFLVTLLAGLALLACTSPTEDRPRDRTPPQVSLTSPVADTTVAASSFTVAGTASDAVGVTRVTLRVNGGAEQDLPISPGRSVSFSFALPLPPGTSTVSVAAYDAAGNQGVAPATRAITYDAAAPSLVLADADTIVNGTDVVVSGTASDETAVRRVAYRIAGGTEQDVPINAGPAVSFSFRVPVGVTASEIEVRAYDGVNNLAQSAFRSRRVVFRYVQPGIRFACGFTLERAVYCWGSNEFGILGPDLALRRSPPVRVARGLAFDTLAVGPFNVCGLTAGRAAYCWGSDFPFLSRIVSEPAAVEGGHQFRSISVGRAYLCALTAESKPFCWGENFWAQLGDGTLTVRKAPVPVSTSTPFSYVAAGSHNTCGADPDGAIHCWGTRYGDNLPPYGPPPQYAPAPLDGDVGFIDLVQGSGFTCGRDRSRKAYCWGYNSSQALGTGSAEPAIQASPVPVAGGLTFRQLAGGSGHACGIATDGKTYCWGDPYGAYPEIIAAPAQVPGDPGFVHIAAGTATCGVTAAGVAYCWGSNQHGTLGDGTLATRTSAVPVVMQP